MNLADFKSQNDVQQISVQQGKGRKFADVQTKTGVQRLFFSTTCDTTKPMYINKGAHEALWVGNNTGAPVVATI